MAAGRQERIGVGIVGLGTAGRLLIPALQKHPGTVVAAVADRDFTTARSVAEAVGARAFASIEDLVTDPAVDAVYIATPTVLHAGHAAVAAAAGKHVLCEKPMAVTMDDGLAMVRSAEAAGVVLMVGHSRSYDAPFARMRQVIGEGTLGQVRMISQLAYTDWMYRPRLAEELVTEKGGGVLFRQGAHQVDILRLLGGTAASVSAHVLDWDARRQGIGAHVLVVDFEGGAVGTATYNGYGAFDSAELAFGIDEHGFPRDGALSGAMRRQFSGGRPEATAKRSRSAGAARGAAPHHPAFGLTLVSCERGDMRQSPDGVYIYDEDGRRELALPADIGPRDMVVAEFYDSVTGVRPPLHDGRWGLANLEICWAALDSARLGRPVELRFQRLRSRSLR